VVLQPRTNCGVGEVAFTVQLLLAGTSLLVVKVDTLTLYSFELVYLCTKGVYVSHDTGVP